jgi:hypothetical protein
MYKVELRINNKTQRANGETLLAALKSLKEPESIKAAGTIKVSRGLKKTERVFTVPKLKSLFNKTTDIYRIVMAKNLELFLK